MFNSIRGLTAQDSDYPARASVLETLTRVLNGQLYDSLPYEFHDERGAGGEYIPLRLRKPSVRYPLCRIVVEDSVSLLFSDGHFPTFDCPDPLVRNAIAVLAQSARLNLVMTEAAIKGAVGSVAILMRILNGRVFFQVMDTCFLTPGWDPQEPDTLQSVTERYKVAGDRLSADGYDIPDPAQDYWFQRTWDNEVETWYLPLTTESDAQAAIDTARTTRHGLGFVPIVWIRNLPGYSSTGDPNDGACTFRAAIETQIEIDYQLSQAGRGLKYSSDPTLLLKDPAGGGADIIKGAGNALIVGENGDARLLEIGGTAAAAVVDYVRTLRELALESIHGNRASPDRLTTAQSGRALELMNQGLLWLADSLRVTYGAALMEIAGMIAKASTKYPLRAANQSLPDMDPATPFSLRWPQWYPPSASERQLDAATVVTLVQNGLLSRASARKALSSIYDLNNLSDEDEKIADDLKETSFDD